MIFDISNALVDVRSPIGTKNNSINKGDAEKPALQGVGTSTSNITLELIEKKSLKITEKV